MTGGHNINLSFRPARWRQNWEFSAARTFLFTFYRARPASIIISQSLDCNWLKTGFLLRLNQL